jgi:hyaluronoglucosaminidase
VHLVNLVATRLGPERRLIVCPTIYCGRGDEPYVATLGRGIDPRIELFWTGRAVCSPTLELDDARRFAAATGRPPTYWDNYPVNDVAMNNELHIGPYRGRDAELWRSAHGVIANGMELFESSKIPFATIADYLAAPAGYDAEASWQQAMLEVVGGDDLDAFALFADNVRTSCLATDDAPMVARALERFAFGLEHGDEATAADDLQNVADRLLAAAQRLLRGPVANPDLIEECRPWIEAFEVGALAISRTAELAAAGRLREEATMALRPFLAELRERRVRVFGDALDMFLSDLSVTHVRPGRHLARQGGGIQ